MIVFQYSPVFAFFDLWMLSTDRCISSQAFYTGLTASNLILDLAILALSLHMVMGLQVPTQQQICLAGIFALVMRIVLIHDLRKEDLSCKLHGSPVHRLFLKSKKIEEQPNTIESN